MITFLSVLKCSLLKKRRQLFDATHLKVQIQRQWNINRHRQPSSPCTCVHTFIQAIQAPGHFNLRPEWVLKKATRLYVYRAHTLCCAGSLKKLLSENKISAAKKVCCCLSVVKNQQLKVSKEWTAGRPTRTQLKRRRGRYTGNEWWWWKRVVRCPAMNIYWPLHHEYVDFSLPQQTSGFNECLDPLRVEISNKVTARCKRISV